MCTQATWFKHPEESWSSGQRSMAQPAELLPVAGCAPVDHKSLFGLAVATMQKWCKEKRDGEALQLFLPRKQMDPFQTSQQMFHSGYSPSIRSQSNSHHLKPPLKAQTSLQSLDISHPYKEEEKHSQWQSQGQLVPRFNKKMFKCAHPGLRPRAQPKMFQSIQLHSKSDAVSTRTHTHAQIMPLDGVYVW